MKHLGQRLLRKASALASGPQREYRREQRAAMPDPQVEEWHTAEGGLLPSRMALLERLPKRAVVAEIGVASGDFSAEILARCQPRVLHLIDAWETRTYRGGRSVVASRFKREIEDGRVRLHQGLSVDVLRRFADGSCDWVYLDTDHTYRTTAEELPECERVVKPGGRIAGHDFCTGSPVPAVVFGVVPAVNEFCLGHGWRYEYVTLESDGHFSFCLKRG